VTVPFGTADDFVCSSSGHLPVPAETALIHAGASGGGHRCHSAGQRSRRPQGAGHPPRATSRLERWFDLSGFRPMHQLLHPLDFVSEVRRLTDGPRRPMSSWTPWAAFPLQKEACHKPGLTGVRMHPPSAMRSRARWLTWGHPPTMRATIRPGRGYFLAPSFHEPLAPMP